jgi:hypothetical protein
MRIPRLPRLAGHAAVGVLALAVVPLGATAASAASPGDTVTTQVFCTQTVSVVPDPVEGKTVDITSNECSLESGPAPSVPGNYTIILTAGSETNCPQLTTVTQNDDGTYEVSGMMCQRTTH